jgi:Na+/H+-dicarboxylate symporter
VAEQPANDTSSHEKHLVPVLPIVAAAILGITFGLIAPSHAASIKIVGIIFLNLLFVLVIPLIVSSMITGVNGLGDIRHVGTIGLRTVIYYLLTTFLSVATGIVLVLLIKPGASVERGIPEFPDASYRIAATPLSGGSVLQFTGDSTSMKSALNPSSHRIELMDQDIIGIIDQHATVMDSRIPIQSWLAPDGGKTEPKLEGRGVRITLALNPPTREEALKNYIPRNIILSMAEENIFPLILFSLFFGAVLSTMGAVGKPLLDVFTALNETIIRCVMFVMYTAPIGIFGLTAGSIGEAELASAGGFLAELSGLARYAFTVLAGLTVHGAVTLPLILIVLAKRKPIRFFRVMIPQIMTAFSTASSMATLPVSLTLATKENKISERIAGFVLPIGATINMDGTALYEGVAAIFIAQIYGIEIGLLQVVIIMLTATIASIGAAAIPQAGLVTMVVVLKSVGLPVEGIGLILSIDWFLDRFRTSVNAWGDVVGAAVIDRYERTGGER